MAQVATPPLCERTRALNRAVALLVTLLVVQCGVIAVVYRPVESRAGGPAEDRLVAFNPAAIDRITIGDEHGNEVVLARPGEHWIIPDLFDLPADTARVDALLHALAAGNRGWPVARSASAHRRFQVEDHHYRRRLALAAGDATAATVYLGNSPGFRRVYARNGDGQAVYSIELDASGIPAVADRWLDPRLLQVRVAVRIDADLFSLRLEDGVWVTGGGNAPDPSELEVLLTALKTLQVDGVAGEDETRRLSGVEADAILDVASLSGKVTLALFALDHQYFIHSSEYPLFFAISEADFRRLAEPDIALISGEPGGP